MKLTDKDGKVRMGLKVGDVVEVAGSQTVVRRIWDGEFSRTVALTAPLEGAGYQLMIADEAFPSYIVGIADDTEATIDAALETIARYERAWAGLGRGAASAAKTGRM